MPVTGTSTDQLCINVIRALSIDAVQNAGAGHPGTPLGIAPVMYLLWARAMHQNPANPRWPNRDRFLLSAGHACAAQYASMFLTGYDVSLGDLKQFRQWRSRAPGHPEYGVLPGIEATTGPLGQGFGMGVGMAIAEEYLAHRYNRPGFPLLNHYIYAVCSDGDLMEGISHEAASLAGALKLGNLIYIYDRNEISIDGPTGITFREDVAARFQAYGWHVQEVEDANDLDALEAALHNAREDRRPSLIIQRSHIGYASPLQDSSAAHGRPLGEDAVRQTKQTLGYPSPDPFYLPDEAVQHTRRALRRGQALEAEWTDMFSRYEAEHPELAREFRALVMERLLPEEWDGDLPDFPSEKPMATRSASSAVMAEVARKLPTFLGGAADLASSANTALQGLGDFSAEDRAGRNIWFGVREHTMGAIANGMGLYGGVFPFTGTFFVFSDYMRPTLRLGALMGVPVVHVFTHDSIGLGEDGPTHQPVEHLPAVRAIPNYVVIRPADANETREAWRVALQRRDGPTALVLTRQNVPVLERSDLAGAEGLHNGAYSLWESSPTPELLLLASGSEVAPTLEAGRTLAVEGIAVRVVSMPSWELFQQQSQQHQDSVLPRSVKARVAVEAASPMGWREWVGPAGDTISVTTFGSSAPGGRVLQEYGFSRENIAERGRCVLKRVREGS